jgi:hypothetical protein
MNEQTEGRVWRLDQQTECQAFRIKGRGLVVNVPPALVGVMPGLAVGDLVSWESGWHRVVGIEMATGRGGVGLVLAAAEEPSMRPVEILADQERRGQLNPEEVVAVRDALASVRATMAFDVLDWSRDSHDAWLYGILVGYEGALELVAEKHKWKDEDVARLRTFRAAIARMEWPK